VGEPGVRAGISMTDALTCVSFLKLDSVGVNTGGDRWFKGESSTGIRVGPRAEQQEEASLSP